MAGPVAAYIQLPDDSLNTGKKMRSQTRVVGGQVVSEHYYVPNHAYTLVGRYHFSGLQKTILQAVQNGTTTGFYWFQNPVASTITGVLRRLMMDYSIASALACPTAPRLNAQKFTFTGTASGASEASTPYQTAGAAAQIIARTAMTGMTVSLVNSVGHLNLPAIMTAVGIYGGFKELLARPADLFQRGVGVELAPGEGLAIWQDVGGTASDTRLFGVEMDWDELDLA